MNFFPSAVFFAPAIRAILAGTMAVSSGYTNSTGNLEYLLDRPKKSMTGPAPNWPSLMPSGTPKERSVKAALLPDMRISVLHPCSQPSPCNMVSTVRCMVPERDGEVVPTLPNHSGLSRSDQVVGAASFLALIRRVLYMMP